MGSGKGKARRVRATVGRQERHFETNPGAWTDFLKAQAVHRKTYPEYYLGKKDPAQLTYEEMRQIGHNQLEDFFSVGALTFPRGKKASDYSQVLRTQPDGRKAIFLADESTSKEVLLDEFPVTSVYNGKMGVSAPHRFAVSYVAALERLYNL